MVKPTAFREAVGFLRTDFKMSERRACRVLGFCRASAQYQSRRESPEQLVAKLRELATLRPRWGYRRLHVLLKREGVAVNHKRVFRLYRLGRPGRAAKASQAARLGAADGVAAAERSERALVDGLRGRCDD
jgi:putative transposase